MTIKYIEGEKKFLIGSSVISLQAPIWAILEYNNRVLVTLDPKFGSRNILCFDQSGQLIWTIQKTDYFKESDTHGFSGASIGEVGRLENRLIATMFGRPFFLDINTGKVEVIPGNFEK